MQVRPQNCRRALVCLVFLTLPSGDRTEDTPARVPTPVAGQPHGQVLHLGWLKADGWRRALGHRNCSEVLVVALHVSAIRLHPTGCASERAR